MFGVTDEGFVAKRLDEIKQEIQDSITTVFGSGVNFDERGPFGQLIGIFAERESLLWELAEDVYNSQWPQNAKGVGVDNSLSLVGLVRKPATQSSADLKFFGSVGTIIPIGAQVSRNDDSTTVFETTESGTILAGSGTDEVQAVAFSLTPDAGSFTLDLDGNTSAAINFNDNAAAIQAILEALPNIGAGNILVAGAIDDTTGLTLTFQGALAETSQEQFTVASNTLVQGATPVVITPSTTTEGELPNITIPSLSTVAGSLAAPAATLTTLDTAPPAGFDSVTNPLDAEIGDDIETDADAKARRNVSVANPGNATLEAIKAKLLQVAGVQAVRMFENTALVPDLAGRPGKSYEAIVQSGDDDEIAQVMFETKPAGILQVGSVAVIVKDSDGFDQEQRFSRPTGVDIYVDIALVTDGNFPVDGLTQVEDAILAYGDALSISDDVIVIPQLICSFASIPGIIDINAKVGAAPIPADGSDTISFTNDFGDLLGTTVSPHGLAVDNRVTFSNTGGALPTGLNPTDVFWIVDAPGANTLKFSASRGGDPIDFTDGGTGVHTISFGGREDNIVIEDTERALFDSSRITVTN
jgi:uncharacterized phage protein gp47/JayE